MLDTLLLSENRRTAGLALGMTVGALGGLLALLVVLFGPVVATGLVLGLGVGLYILSDLHGGLYAVLAVVALLPFGKLPFPQLPVTPSFLDAALGGFVAVYLAQWMTGQRRLFRTTPVMPVVLAFTGVMIFAFLMGLRHALLTPRDLRNVLEMALSLLVILVLVDVVRDVRTLQRAIVALIGFATLSALLGIVLWVMPDPQAEALLNRLGRFDYPVGGVLRYRATSATLLNERAIGTWIDPNAFGGFLQVAGAVIAPHIFARKPVINRWLAALSFGIIFVALFLTDSRGAMLALGMALVFIAALRYRRLLLIMALVVLIALFLPVTQRYIDKLEAGVTNQDVETQMRWGEYKDALRLINRHPIIGVGFSGTPEIDLYLGVANTYLTVASNAGFVGLFAYLVLMGSPFLYSAIHYRQIQAHPVLSDIWLGLAAGLVGVLVGGVFDHFYFKIDQFYATMAFVWIIYGLLLAAVRLAVRRWPPPAR
jgi:polysaccharide biosynthesis protein PslJ